jgi:CheY-like chemotaxis protein
MTLTFVLSVGLDRELLGTRNLVLQSAGYTVVAAYSIKEAVDRLQGGDFDLVLLCQSLPANERDGLSCWIRASGLRIPVASVSSKLRSSDAFSGTTIDSAPDALLRGIREVLISAKNLAPRTAMTFNKYEGDAAQGEKPPAQDTGYEQQTESTKERCAPLARRG